MKKIGIKHLISCHCTLKIFEKNTEIQDHIYHKFPVYSQINEKTGKLVPKMVMCNNCNTTHNVYDYCKSELVDNPSESSGMVMDIDDIKIQLSEKVVGILEKYEVDISTWEHVLDIFEKEAWGENVVLTRSVIDQLYHVKILQIISENKFKILTKVLKDEINL